MSNKSCTFAAKLREMNMDKRIYIEPFTGFVKLEAPVYTCRAEGSEPPIPSAPARMGTFEGKKATVNILYI